MICQNLYSGQNNKNISKCRLQKILPRVLSLEPASNPDSLAADIKAKKFQMFFLHHLKAALVKLTDAICHAKITDQKLV